jgi:alkanesulfonate monooxygenase SsuD/methylene tetrahydromethanopterin reductase-like flavin-dependent oxidoreductase (luciferase family)
MIFFGLRFDFRNPVLAATSMTDRYRAALDMCEWADGLGFVVIAISEHHGSPDGYLPSPLPMAAAIAARTQRARIQIAAVIAPFHDPLRLAEDVAVVDRISGGRLDLIIANGYVPAEFEMFGCPIAERARRTTETLATLRRAWTGEPFEHRGRPARITPTPHQQGGPKLVLGGSSEAAARRAARIADGFLPSTPDVWTHYVDECLAIGKPDPGPPFGGDTRSFYLARDVEEGWREFGPYALHEMNAYGEWMVQAGAGTATGYAPTADLDALRATEHYRVLTPDDMLAEFEAAGPLGFAMFHPMIGGMPPDLGWKMLRLFESDVLPRIPTK